MFSAFRRSQNSTGPNAVVQENMFNEPVKEVEKSGGTASLVILQPRSDSRFSSYPDGYFIGKDTSHATSEVQFYEEVRVKRSELRWDIFSFMLRYEGTFSLATRTAGNRVLRRNYLVVENLLFNQLSPRLIDIKIGALTTDKHWRGKSRFAAWRGRQVDRVTNSEKEGYRMEGMQNPPVSLQSMGASVATWKRSQRLIYQRQPAKEFLFQFLDTHHLQIPIDIADSLVHPVEFGLMLHEELLRKLFTLLEKIRSVPIPQKWVATSLVVCFDTGALPKRAGLPQDESLNVKLLDWGRSELTSDQVWKSLSEFEQADRRKFWTEYEKAVSRLLYETSRRFYLMYCKIRSPDRVRIEVFDYDLFNDDDFIGHVDLQLSSIGPTEFLLLSRDGGPVLDEKRRPAAITVSVVQMRIHSKGTLFPSYYRINVIGGINFPRMDIVGTGACDPYARVISGPEGVLLGRTKVCGNSRCPQWDAMVDVPNCEFDAGLRLLLGAMNIVEPPSAVEGGTVARDLFETLFGSSLSDSELVSSARVFHEYLFQWNNQPAV